MKGSGFKRVQPFRVPEILDYLQANIFILYNSKCQNDFR